MAIDGLDTTNFWLGVIAVVSVIQILALATVAFLAYRLYARATTLLDELEARHVAPLAARATRIMDEVQGITARVKEAEEALLGKMKQVAHTSSYAVAAVKARSWPVVGVLRGIRAGWEVLCNRETGGGTNVRTAISRP